ncbi:MAG: multicopper oxidase domain-containing protein [Spirochaetales bacterium]|nr:multicopper oxidase domain-containing protein [Spirochaetales bacterium]
MMITLVLRALLLAGFTVSVPAGLPLPIPPLLEGKSLELTIQEGVLTLPEGISETLGFNGDYLGPTLRFSRGDKFNVDVINTLDEDTTVHWHGMHLPAEADGGPRQIINAGSRWQPRFTVDQQAATLWYHPHLMGKTAEHVYRGLAGLIYIEDSYSKSLDIPSEYGVNDIPLVIQDRRIRRDGSFIFNPGMHDVMQGYIGNTLLVNGASDAELKVPGGTYRLRVLNGSNSSIYRIRFSDGRPFTVIALDGGFLPDSHRMEQLILTSGERYEILVDFKPDEEVEVITDIYNSESYTALKIETTSEEAFYTDHPEQFRPYEISMADRPDGTRRFVMESRGMSGFMINGKTMSLRRIDERVQIDTTEVWVVENPATGMMMRLPHSFHVHDVQFLIRSINGEPPPPWLSGPKDTILLFPGDVYELILRFEDYEGIYMYHCHFLEHEDSGMMGQFEVVSPR